METSVKEILWLELATDLNREFAKRSGDYDKQATFVEENYIQLKEHVLKQLQKRWKLLVVKAFLRITSWKDCSGTFRPANFIPYRKKPNYCSQVNIY